MTITHDVTFQKTQTPGRTAVLVDGAVVGEVFRERVSTVTRYSGRMYGRETSRQRWAWEGDFTLLNLSGGDFATRKEAVDDLLCFI